MFMLLQVNGKMPERIEITKDTPLAVGDTVEIRFRAMGMLLVNAAQAAAIEAAIKKFKQFDLRRIHYAENSITYQLKVVKNPVTLTLIIYSIVVVSAALLIFLSLDKIYKIAESPGSISSGLWAIVAGLVVLALLKIRK